jgi:HD-like signal output (HDOD) protein
MMDRTKTLEGLIAETSDLPTLPAAAHAVIKEANSPIATARSISHHLAQDQALATRVLRLANSAYYGLSRRVSDIHEAVLVLGMRSVRNLAVVASSYRWMSKPFEAYGLGSMQLWKHASGTAVAAHTVASRAGAKDADIVFTAGLIHNVGMSVLSSRIEGIGPVLLQAAESGRAPFREVESGHFGFDHAAVGSYLAEQWNLPDSLVAAIRYHHSPEDAPAHQHVVDCMHVGESIVWAMDLGICETGMLHPVSAAALRRLEVQPSEYEDLVAACVEKYADHVKLYGVELDSQVAA